MIFLSPKFCLNPWWPLNILLGIVLTAWSMGCALGMKGELVDKPTAASEAQSPPPTQAKPFIAPSAIKETSLEEQAFKLQDLVFWEEYGQTVFRVTFSNPVHQYRHFTLVQPSRIVLDIFGDAKRIPPVETFRVNSNWVETLRLSSSEGYLRLTMDIAAAKVPAYIIEPESGGLKMVIGPTVPEATGMRQVQLVEGGKRIDVRAADAKPAVPRTASSAVLGQPVAKGEKKYTGHRISLEFKDTNIKDVLDILAKLNERNIVVTDDVQKRVTMRLDEVPSDQALDIVIDTNGLEKREVGNVIRISTPGRFRSDSEARAASERAKDIEEPLQTEYLTINYAKVKDLESKIKPLLSTGPRTGTVVLDERSNTILVRDIQKRVDEVRELVTRLDTRTPQVLIESNLIETTPTFARAIGMKLEFNRSAEIKSNFPAGLPATSTPFVRIFQDRAGGFGSLTAELTAAEKEGLVKIISRPSVVTLNNVDSTIQSLRIIRVALPTSTNIASGTGAAAGAAVATEKINVGIILNVTPQVSSDGFILMNIKVKSSSIADSPTVAPTTGGAGTSVIPFDELSREAISNVLVRDGETIVIGGILKDTKNTSESGIPWLKDVPVLGWLFKNIRWQKDFEELVVFITPRVIGGGSENLPTADQLWRNQMRQTEGG
ncbi:MAG: AMIN domain-containing protein [Deltaproteobacteria bacterium]|nr:AMIN domain-containing protein [Deltaproteobacteria bacterium]